MTFDKAAWAIDGPLTKASLARTEAYAALGGAEGIVSSGDLKVLPLATPGAGIRIAAGAGVVLNRYQGTAVNQSYVVTNEGEHVISGAEMPTSSPSTQLFVVGVVVGDPDFNQSGHPFMPTTIPEGDESTFTYVRPKIIPASVFGTLSGVGSQNWPFLPLAVLTVPASTTTITSSMILDIRTLAQPRSWLAQGHSVAAAQTLAPAVGTWTQFGPDVLTVKVPTWAAKAKVMGFVEGARLEKAGLGGIQPYIKSTALVAASTNISESAPNTAGARRTYNVGGEIDVTSVRGSTLTFALRGTINNSGSSGFLKTDTYSSVMLSVYFEEVPT